MGSLREYRIEDDLAAVQKGAVEVVVTMVDGASRWCYFMTPAALASAGDWVPDTQVRLHYGAPHMIVVSELNEDIIARVLDYLDQSGELETVTVQRNLPSMTPFPRDWELISFFEAEPQVLDPGVPWCYNSLEFVTTRREGTIRCTIEPGFGTIRLHWDRDEQRVLDLTLNCVSGIELETGRGRDVLVASFRNKGVSSLRLQLKPTVHIEWGTGVEPS